MTPSILLAMMLHPSITLGEISDGSSTYKATILQNKTDNF